MLNIKELVLIIEDENESKEKRIRALVTLQRLRSEAMPAASLLIQLLSEPDKDFQLFAVDALASIGEPVIEVLVQAAPGANNTTRRNIAKVLGELGLARECQ